jgi:predicted lipid-binding transport protein (Tim44 family)
MATTATRHRQTASTQQGVLPGVLGGLAGGLAFGLMMGALLLMAVELGMPLFTIDTMALQSLVGHLVLGCVLGAVVVALSRPAGG